MVCVPKTVKTHILLEEFSPVVQPVHDMQSPLFNFPPTPYFPLFRISGLAFNRDRPLQEIVKARHPSSKCVDIMQQLRNLQLQSKQTNVPFSNISSTPNRNGNKQYTELCTSKCKSIIVKLTPHVLQQLIISFRT